MSHIKRFDIVPMKDPNDYLEIAEAKAIIEAAKKPMEKLLFTTLLETGRRVSEVVRGPYENLTKQRGLRVEDIDPVHNVIIFSSLKKRKRVRKPKPANPRLIKALMTYIEDERLQPWNFIFPITPQESNRLLKRAAKAASITKRVHNHIFRHTMLGHGASRTENAEDIVQLSELVDHSSIEVTMWYLRRFKPGRAANLVKKMWDDNG